MKYLLAIILFFNLFFVDKKDDKKPEEASVSNIINIQIIDKDTKEELFAVKNIDKYSDFDGKMKINRGDSISLTLISYKDINIKTVKNDTIIGMSKVN